MQANDNIIGPILKLESDEKPTKLQLQCVSDEIKENVLYKRDKNDKNRSTN